MTAEIWVLAVSTLIQKPCGLPKRHPGRVDLDRTVGKHQADLLKGTNRLAELMSCPSVLHCKLEQH